jgi:hypothetical protein
MRAFASIVLNYDKAVLVNLDEVFFTLHLMVMITIALDLLKKTIVLIKFYAIGFLIIFFGG